MTNEEISECVYLTFNSKIRLENFHLQCGIAMDMIIKTSLARKSTDNVTGIIIAFQNLENYFINNNRIKKPFSICKKVEMESLINILKEEKKNTLHSSKISICNGIDTPIVKKHIKNYISNDMKIEKEKKIKSYENILNISEMKVKEVKSKNFSSENDLIMIKKNYKPSIVIDLNLKDEYDYSKINKKKHTSTLRNPSSCRSVNRIFFK